MRRWTIKKYDSFEAMEQDQLEQFAKLTPAELLLRLKQLNLAAYGIKDESTLLPVRTISFRKKSPR